MIIELQPGAIPHNGVACYCDDFGLVR
jgi:hypothetical protein